MHIMEHSLRCKTPTGSTELVRLPKVIVTLLEGKLLDVLLRGFQDWPKITKMCLKCKTKFLFLRRLYIWGFLISSYHNVFWYLMALYTFLMLYIVLFIYTDLPKQKQKKNCSLFFPLFTKHRPYGSRDERSLFLHFFLSGSIASMCGKYSLHWVWVCCSKV